MTEEYIPHPTKNFTPRKNPPIVRKPQQVEKEPKTEEEAADMLQRAAWASLSRLVAIIDNPHAPDSLVVQAAKEIAAQMHKKTVESANNGDDEKVDKIEVILVAPDGTKHIVEQ